MSSKRGHCRYSLLVDLSRMHAKPKSGSGIGGITLYSSNVSWEVAGEGTHPVQRERGADASDLFLLQATVTGDKWSCKTWAFVWVHCLPPPSGVKVSPTHKLLPLSAKLQLEFWFLELCVLSTVSSHPLFPLGEAATCQTQGLYRAWWRKKR